MPYYEDQLFKNIHCARAVQSVACQPKGVEKLNQTVIAMSLECKCVHNKTARI